jgi:Leucine-rich repeat (LRR) protein
MYLFLLRDNNKDVVESLLLLLIFLNKQKIIQKITIYFDSFSYLPSKDFSIFKFLIISSNINSLKILICFTL